MTLKRFFLHAMTLLETKVLLKIILARLGYLRICVK